MSAELEIVEGTAGTWHYHLRRAPSRATVCGNERVMSTQLPLTAWGTKSHLNERWCESCSAWKQVAEELAKRRGPT